MLYRCIFNKQAYFFDDDIDDISMFSMWAQLEPRRKRCITSFQALDYTRTGS